MGWGRRRGQRGLHVSANNPCSFLPLGTRNCKIPHLPGSALLHWTWMLDSRTVQMSTKGQLLRRVLGKATLKGLLVSEKGSGGWLSKKIHSSTCVNT